MKAKTRTASKARAPRLLEISLLALPVLALTPNFFIPPALSYLGLPTQEFVFASVAAILAGFGLFSLGRTPTATLALERAELMMLLALALFIVGQAVTLVWAPAFYDGVRVVGIWIGFAVVFAITLTLGRRVASWLQYVLAIIAVVLAVSVFYDRALYGDLMQGIFFSSGITAELLATMLPLWVLSYLSAEKIWQAVISLAIAGLSMAALIVGLRRGPILAMAIVLLLIGLALIFKQIKLYSRQRLVIVSVVFVLAVGVVGWRYREAISYRIAGATQLEAEEGGLTTRLRGYITAWEMGKRHALVGVGVGGYPSLYGQYRRYFASNPQYTRLAQAAGAEDYDEIHSPLAHNEYLQIFVELGVIGLLLFGIFCFLVVRRLWRGWRATGDWRGFSALLSLVAFGISSAFSAFSFRYPPGPLVLTCLLGIGFAFTKPEPNATTTINQTHALPKFAVLAAVIAALLANLYFAGRAYNVWASQELQGQAHARIEPLDFSFYPNNPAGNEALQRRYEQVLAFDSANAGAHLGYALLLFQMKKPAEAQPHAEFAQRHGYSRPFGYVLLAFIYEQTGEMEKAVQTLADCVVSYPYSPFVRASYAEMLRRAGRQDQLANQQPTLDPNVALMARSWELYLRAKPEAAATEAKQRGLLTPEAMWPRLAFTLVLMRAYHYLK
jgi:tetratricopeptide (TPR) repeat protein